jgi:phosphoglycolate phosphatase
MLFKAVLFDLDGTLLDTLEDIASSVNLVLLKHDFPTHGIDDYRSFISNGVATLIKRSLPKDNRNEETISEFVKEFREEYSLNWNIMTKPYDGMLETLDELSARQLMIGIVSNKSHYFTKKCINKFFPNSKIDFILGHYKGIPLKPDPTGAKLFTKKAGIPPEQILFVGDSSVDMKTATAAGMYPVGVLWGFKSIEELQRNGAKALIQHPKEILSLVTG